MRDIREGKVQKGGQNGPPTTERPGDPVGQAGYMAQWGTGPWGELSYKQQHERLLSHVDSAGNALAVAQANLTEVTRQAEARISRREGEVKQAWDQLARHTEYVAFYGELCSPQKEG